MTQGVTLDKDKAAVIIMDFQNGIVGSGVEDPEGVVKRAASALNGARSAGIPVIYVVHRGGRFETASQDSEIHPGVAPAEGERVISKTKAGSFSTTGLDVILREMGKDTLILMGVATSGCVLSTMRWATDINYKVWVISDGCADRDSEVHRVLTEKIYPRQGTVVKAEEFLNVLGQL